MARFKNHKGQMARIQAQGRSVDAELAFFLNDEFRQFYKKGDMSVRNCWLYMVFMDQRLNTWSNSHHYSLDRMVDFYRNLGFKPELIPIEQAPDPE